MSSEPSPITPASSSELPIIEACLDLIRWFVPLLQRLPRQHRFGLGDRLIGHLYHLLEQLVQARYAHAKLPILEPLKAQIVVIQLQIRLLHESATTPSVSVSVASPSTLHRQSRWKGFEREHRRGHRPEGPDPLP